MHQAFRANQKKTQLLHSTVPRSRSRLFRWFCIFKVEERMLSGPSPLSIDSMFTSFLKDRFALSSGFRMAYLQSANPAKKKHKAGNPNPCVPSCFCGAIILRNPSFPVVFGGFSTDAAGAKTRGNFGGNKTLSRCRWERVGEWAGDKPGGTRRRCAKLHNRLVRGEDRRCDTENEDCHAPALAPAPAAAFHGAFFCRSL